MIFTGRSKAEFQLILSTLDSITKEQPPHPPQKKKMPERTTAYFVSTPVMHQIKRFING
jgi:hypothetical protein